MHTTYLLGRMRDVLGCLQIRNLMLQECKCLTQSAGDGWLCQHFNLALDIFDLCHWFLAEES